MGAGKADETPPPTLLSGDSSPGVPGTPQVAACWCLSLDNVIIFIWLLGSLVTIHSGLCAPHGFLLASRSDVPRAEQRKNTQRHSCPGEPAGLADVTEHTMTSPGTGRLGSQGVTRAMTVPSGPNTRTSRSTPQAPSGGTDGRTPVRATWRVKESGKGGQCITVWTRLSWRTRDAVVAETRVRCPGLAGPPYMTVWTGHRPTE